MGSALLPIDPADIGRSYEAVIRVNSQSGKGGVAYILETEYQIRLPKAAQPAFSKVVQQVTDETSKEITAAGIWDLFEREYLVQEGPFELVSFASQSASLSNDLERISAVVRLRRGSCDQGHRQWPDRRLRQRHA